MRTSIVSSLYFTLYFYDYDDLLIILYHNFVAVKEREKIQKKAVASSSSRPASGMNTPKNSSNSTPKKGVPSKKSGSSTPIRGVDPRHLDLSALNLTPRAERDDVVDEPPKVTFARERLIEEARRSIEADDENTKKGISLVVIGININ